MAVGTGLAAQGQRPLAFLDDCSNRAPVQVAGWLLLAPAVLGFVAFLGFELRRWWRVRHGRAVQFQCVVRGSGAGLYYAPMPGRLHLTPDGVWWVAEGSDRPVPLRGVPVLVSADGDVVEELPSLALVCPDGAHTPAAVPRPLWSGTIDGPTTVLVVLDAGGYAEVTVRGESVGQVLDAMVEPEVHPTPAPPVVVGRAPMVRFTMMIVGACLTPAGLGAAALWQAHDCGSFVGEGMWGLALLGVSLLVIGGWMLREREAAVRASRPTLNLRAPTDVEAGGIDSDPGDVTDAAADPLQVALPDEAVLTYRTIRGLLARRSEQEEWAAVKARDPRNERRARRVVGARSLNHARAAVSDPVRTQARYLLVRNWAGQDELIVFPPHGDVAPIGVIDMLRTCLGPIPLEGTVWLAGPVDPATRQPKAQSWVVPILDSTPLWPGWPLEQLDSDDINALVAGANQQDGDACTTVRARDRPASR